MVGELVSVVIPLYNKEVHIAAALESVINQDYENLEIILVNDASTDSSLKISENILAKSKRSFTIINHEINRGKSAARNTGLDASNGKYIWFCDADDIAEKNLVSRLIGLAEEYNCDISFGGYKKHFEDGRPDEYELINLNDPQPLDGEKVMCLRMLSKISPVLCTTLFMKDLLTKYNIRYYEGCTAYQDIEFQLKAFCHATKFSYAPESLYIYIHSAEMGAIRENNTPEKDLKKYIDSTDAHFRAAEYISQHTKFDKVKFLADNMLIPEAIVRKFTFYARADDREKFASLLNDEKVRNSLRNSRKVLLKKPEIYLKAFMILHMPNLYFKLRKKA